MLRPLHLQVFVFGLGREACDADYTAAWFRVGFRRKVKVSTDEQPSGGRVLGKVVRAIDRFLIRKPKGALFVVANLKITA